MALAKFQSQKVVLQINLITEENQARAYHQTFYQIERILTALDLIATIFLLVIEFLSFVADDLHHKTNTLTTAWGLGYFRVYLITFVIWLFCREGLVTCGRIFYGHHCA